MPKSTCKTFNGSRAWYIDLESYVRHRVDGPAIEYENGSELWFYYGKWHDVNMLNKWPVQLYLGYLKWNKKQRESNE